MPPKPKRTEAAAAQPGPPPPPAPPPAPSPPPAPASRWSVGTALIAVLVALTLVLTVVGVVRMRGGDEGFKPDLGVPTEASVADLRDLASPSRPVYWTGPPASGKLEVTRTSRDAVYVRYLPEGVELGNGQPKYTTIATYPMPNAYSSMLRTSRTKGVRSERVPGGGLAVWRRSPGTSVYVAYPRVKYLVEVYDPSPVRARALALGSLQQVG